MKKQNPMITTYIRTVIFVSYMVTNSFIVSGVIRHWNANTNNTSDSRFGM